MPFAPSHRGPQLSRNSLPLVRLFPVQCSGIQPGICCKIRRPFHPLHWIGYPMKCLGAAIFLTLSLSIMAAQAFAGTSVQRLTADAMEECAMGRQAQTRADRIQHFASGRA